MSLQNTFALQSKYNDKYLCYIDNEDPQLHGFLKFSEDEFSTHSKFHKEPASTADEFINIRSVYSNKYWVSRYENDEHWIVAEANEPNEDQSSSSCTLFQAIPVDDGSAIRLLHVHLNKYVCLSKDSSQFPLCIFAGSVDPDPDRIDVFVVKNIIPPKQSGPSRLAFKGDNEKYLKVEVIDGKPHLKFSAKDTDEAEVWFKCPNIAKKNDTSGHIQSNFNNEFWRQHLLPAICRS
ncbi:uncharacterized protein LOC111022081 [Momordica charantia]|uniref:Uncharacterized protein LOC111022081 n=1 Tax=Momordica charantia TaxID=3673 RepID=A0A6J1DNR0_MOMCH|nr:uncharacterized protein LOC111022081 [Momordica charantia]